MADHRLRARVEEAVDPRQPRLALDPEEVGHLFLGDADHRGLVERCRGLVVRAPQKRAHQHLALWRAPFPFAGDERRSHDPPAFARGHEKAGGVEGMAELRAVEAQEHRGGREVSNARKLARESRVERQKKATRGVGRERQYHAVGAEDRATGEAERETVGFARD